MLYSAFALGDATALDLVVSAAQPALARLYDLDGVLLAESELAGAAELARVGAWAGMVPSARLMARGLAAQQQLILQIVPSAAGGTLSAAGVSGTAW